MKSQKQAFGQKKSSFGTRLTGIVNVVTGETKAELTLVDEGKQFANGTRKFRVPLSDLPKRPALKPNTKGRQLRVRMNPDGDEVEAFTPVNGMFRAKLVDIGPHPEKDADPVPQEKPNFKDPEHTHLEFYASYEIQEGEFRGVIAPTYYLHYKFEEDENHAGYASFTFSLDNKKATRGQQLVDWGDAHGIWERDGDEILGDPIEWDDVTILPTLLERALDNDREVDLFFKDGYIKELVKVESEDESDPDSDDDAPFGSDDDDDELNNVTEDEVDPDDEETEDEFDQKYPPKKSAPAQAKKPAPRAPAKKPVPAKSAPVKKAVGKAKNLHRGRHDDL